MYCDKCGYLIPPNARFCPSCATPVTPGTKTAAALRGAGDAAVNLTKRAAAAAKPAAKGVARLTARALAKVGSLSQRAGSRLNEISSRAAEEETQPATGTGTGTPAPGAIDANTATVKELMTLPGIGEAKAKTLVKKRPYRSIDDLLAVPGISPGTLDRIKGRLKVA